MSRFLLIPQILLCKIGTYTRLPLGYFLAETTCLYKIWLYCCVNPSNIGKYQSCKNVKRVTPSSNEEWYYDANQNYNGILLHTSYNVHHQKSIKDKCWRGLGGKQTLLPCWWEWRLMQPLWRTIWRFLKKLNLELPYDPSIPFLDIWPKKTIIWKDRCTPMFTAVPFPVAKTWKQPNYPSTEVSIKKMWFIYTMEYYLAVKRLT